MIFFDYSRSEEEANYTVKWAPTLDYILVELMHILKDKLSPYPSKDCTLLQRRVMPELEVDCDKDAEKDMSGEEEVVDLTQTTTKNDERKNEDGMEAAL